MDNNIEELIKNTLLNNKNNNNNNVELEDNSYEIEKLLQEIQNSCLSQYDKDKLLQSLYYCHTSNDSIQYYREQLKNREKDLEMENKILQAEKLLSKMNNNLNAKSDSILKIDNEITNIKSNLLHSTINKSKYNEVQIVFESTIEKIKNQFINHSIKNNLSK